MPDDVIYTAVDAKPKTTQRLRRLANIENNPAVSLLVDHYADDWTRVVVGAGRRCRRHSRRRRGTAHRIPVAARQIPQYQSVSLDGPVIAITVPAGPAGTPDLPGRSTDALCWAAVGGKVATASCGLDHAACAGGLRCPETRENWRKVMADRASASQGAGAAPDRERSGRHPQRGSGGAVGRRQDHPGRGAAGRRRGVVPARLGHRRQHGLRLRRCRDPAAALGGCRGGVSGARRHQGQPGRHTRLRRLRGRAAGRAAGRRLRAVRHRGQRGRRRADQVAVAGMQPGRHAPRGGDHQARPRPGELPGGAWRPRRTRSATRFYRFTCRPSQPTATA